MWASRWGLLVSWSLLFPRQRKWFWDLIENTLERDIAILRNHQAKGPTRRYTAEESELALKQVRRFRG